MLYKNSVIPEEEQETSPFQRSTV